MTTQEVCEAAMQPRRVRYMLRNPTGEAILRGTVLACVGRLATLLPDLSLAVALRRGWTINPVVDT